MTRPQDSLERIILARLQEANARIRLSQGREADEALSDQRAWLRIHLALSRLKPDRLDDLEARDPRNRRYDN